LEFRRVLFRSHPVGAHAAGAARVESAFDRIADELVELRVGLFVDAGIELATTIGVERRLRENLAGEADRGAELDPVVRMRHVIEEDARLVARIARPQANPAAALAAHWPDMDLEPVAAGNGIAVVGNGGWQEVELDIGPAHARPRTDETAGFEMIGRAEPVLEEGPARTDHCLRERVERTEKR